MRPAVVACIAIVIAKFGTGCTADTDSEEYVPLPEGTLTFCRDIAPIVFEKCSGCHRPGEATPFDLLTYGDVQARAKQIRFALSKTTFLRGSCIR